MKEKRNILSLINVIISSLVLIGLIILIVINFNNKDANDIFSDTYESIVEIRVTEGEDIGYGSGVIVSGDGKIITNAHVIVYEEDNLFDKVEIRLSYEDEYKEVSILKYDSNKDLALLKLDDVKIKSIKTNTKCSYSY